MWIGGAIAAGFDIGLTARVDGQGFETHGHASRWFDRAV